MSHDEQESCPPSDPTAALHQLVHAAEEGAILARRCFQSAAASLGRPDDDTTEIASRAGCYLLEASAAAMKAYAAITVETKHRQTLELGDGLLAALLEASKVSK